MTDEEKDIMEEWTVTQEEAESEIYANEKHCEKCINFAECVESAIEDRCKTYRESYKDYLNGLTKGKPKWHDLRKNPNDLPETSIYLSNYSDVVLRQDGVQVRYAFEAGEWIFESRSFYERCEVIAWCEKPKFEE